MSFIANFVCPKQYVTMVKIGTTLSPLGKKAVLCGSGELGKEVAIELQRYGIEVVALDRYANAPAMQVAHRSYVLSMLDGAQLRAVIEQEKPDYIIPEIEAIATDTLLELEKEGYNVIPTARATRLTMNREGIRRLAAEELGHPDFAVPFRFRLRGIRRSRRANRDALRREAGNELVGTRAKRRPFFRRDRPGLGEFAERRSGGSRTCDRRRVRRFRL